MSDVDELKIGSNTYRSRLFLGTGKFSSPELMRECIHSSSSEVVTVALRRLDLENPKDPIMLHLTDLNAHFLPNTSGARTASEAIQLAKLARKLSHSNLVKLEVVPNPHHLLPDPIETLIAAEHLVKNGFEVYPYINADPILAKRLEELGCVCVMPLGSPIGSNQGLKTKDQLEIIISQSKVPVVIDAGIGKPSDACLAMEIGADAVLVNTAMATTTYIMLVNKSGCISNPLYS